MLTVAASIFSVSTVSLKTAQEKEKKIRGKKKGISNILKGGLEEGEAIKLTRPQNAPLTLCNI